MYKRIIISLIAFFCSTGIYAEQKLNEVFIDSATVFGTITTTDIIKAKELIALFGIYGDSQNTALGKDSYILVNTSGSAGGLTIKVFGSPGGNAQAQFGALNIISTSIAGPVATHIVSVDSTTDNQQGFGIWELWENNYLHNDPLIWIRDAGHNSNPFIRVDGGAPNLELVNTSTDNVRGLGKWEPFAIAYQGTNLQINSRTGDDSAFESVAYWIPLQKSGAGLYLNSQNLVYDSGVLASSDTLAVNYHTLNNRTVGLTGPLNATASWTFALPSTPNNQGQVLYQSNNGRGKNNNARQWEFTTGGTTGDCLRYNGTSGPYWGTCNP